VSKIVGKFGLPCFPVIGKWEKHQNQEKSIFVENLAKLWFSRRNPFWKPFYSMLTGSWGAALIVH
jgi:hypothetical protein